MSVASGKAIGALQRLRNFLTRALQILKHRADKNLIPLFQIACPRIRFGQDAHNHGERQGTRYAQNPPPD